MRVNAKCKSVGTLLASDQPDKIIKQLRTVSTHYPHAGAFSNNLLTEEQRLDVVRNACPGAGACGGMYTANTMASAIEAMGMSLPYSSSIPATDPLKRMECEQAGRQVWPCSEMPRHKQSVCLP